MHRIRAHVLISLVLCAAVVARGVGTPIRYDLDVHVSFRNATFFGTETVLFANDTDIELTEVFFRLFANAQSIYGNAFLQIDSAEVNGSPIAATMLVENTVAMLPLPMPLAPGQTASLQLDFSGQASLWTSAAISRTPGSGYGILTKSQNALTLTSFYPVVAPYAAEGWSIDPVFGFGDALMADRTDYHVRLTVMDSGVFPVSTGIQQAAQPLESGTRYFFEAPGVRDFSAVLLTHHFDQTIQTDGYTIRSWFAPENQEAAGLCTEMAAFAYTQFRDLMGGAPTTKVELVEVPLQRAAGVEFDGLILVGASYAATPGNLFFSIIISHEMAHQWFYAGVGNDPIEHPWLDEGFATYLSNVFLSVYYDDATAAAERESWWAAYANASANHPTLSIASPKYAFPDSSSYSRFVYSGAATFIHELRETMGETAFLQGLQDYYLGNLGSIAVPDDFFRAFESACSCSLSDLLSAYSIPR